MTVRGIDFSTIMIVMQGDQTKAESIESHDAGDRPFLSNIGSHIEPDQKTGAEIHRIRLRRGWEIELAPNEIDRISLPTCFAPSDQRLARLSRTFQTPPIDHEFERVRIELCNVPGLVSIALNGQNPRDVKTSFYLTRPLAARYQIDLTVDRERAASTIEWGSIALVIENAPTPTNDATDTLSPSDPAEGVHQNNQSYQKGESEPLEAEGSPPRGDDRARNFAHDRESLKG